MRISVMALAIGIFGTLSWALFHQISKKEALPEKIKLYAFYSPSNKGLIEQSISPSLQNEYELVLEERAPENSTLTYKIDLMLRAIKENWGGIFVHSDIEAQHAQPAKETILKALEHTDIIVQRMDETGTVGSGFIACRANKRTLQLWETIKHMLDEDEETNLHPQDYLNSLLQKNKIAKLRWDYLPTAPTQQSNHVA